MHQECAFKGSLPSTLKSEHCQVQWRKAHIENHFYGALCLPQIPFFPLFLSFLLYNFIDHLPIYSLKKNKDKNLFWTQKPKWPKAGKSARKTLIMQGLAPRSTSDTVAFLQTPLSFRQNYRVNQVYSLCSPLSSPRNRLAVVRCLRFPGYCRVCAGFEDT